MITSLLLLLCAAFISTIAAFLPEATTLPAYMTAWVPYFHTGVQFIGFIVPLDQLFVILTSFLAIQAALIAFRIITLAYGLIRGGHVN